jgi:SET domain-containing protein
MRILPPTKIYASKSDIHGYGVFAKEIISEGELIEECPIFDLNIPLGHSSPLFIDYRFNWPQGTHDWKKQVLSWGYGSLYNHSENPNAYWKSNIEKETFEFYSTRQINPDEEILVYYGDVSYWQDGRNHVEVKK